MPRKNLVRTDQHPYHVTIRCNNKEWFDLPLDDVWSICLKGIKHAQKRHCVDIQAFVLMGNHYHLLVWTPQCNLDQFMFEFNSYISKKIREKTQRINRIFGDRYKWCLIDNQNYYLSVLRYIYQNPVKAKIVSECHAYKYSSLHYLIFERAFPCAIYQPEITEELYREGYFERDLNEREKLTKAMSRSQFSVPKSKTARRSI